MYVDGFNAEQMTVVINMQGKLEAPVFFKGGVWDLINTAVHENDHRNIGPATLNKANHAALELRAIRTQRAHPSWKRVTKDYIDVIRNYELSNGGK